MHPIDIENTLATMKILVDSREQDTEQAKKRYADFGVPWERSKLDFGDYSALFILPDNSLFDLRKFAVVERKMSIDELCCCYTRDRKRFEKEFERAKKANAKIYLLVENGSLKKIYGGNYRSEMKPKALVASIFAWLARYDCQIIMVDKDLSGKVIKEILYREAKEILTQME